MQEGKPKVTVTETGPKKVTVPTLQVLDALLAEPNRDDWFAVEVCRLTKLGSGTVSQILFRLEQWGWLKSWWEDASVAYAQRRPRRRFAEGPRGVAVAELESCARAIAATPRRRDRFECTPSGLSYTGSSAETGTL